MNTLRGLCLWALLMPLLEIQVSGSANPPNILYIFTDDQSYRTVSCYPRSYNYADTPNIDALAEQGIRFDQAYIGAKCVPSRATALTGRLQFAVNSNYDGSAIEGNTYWVPTLRENGYYTGMIGKWHFGGGAQAHQHGISWDWSVVWDHGAYKSYDEYYNGQYVMINGAPDAPLGGYSTDRYTDYTEQFIYERAQEPDKPWFFWLCYAGIHSPYTPADRHKGMLDDEPETAIPEDVWGPRHGKPSHFQDSKWQMGEDGKPYWKNKSLDFWAKQQTEAVASIDEGVGRIVAALEATGQLDNTIIIFTSDQGYVWGHHGLKGKIDPYETAIRAPFIVSNPTRFPTNKICKAPINGPDVIRTFHAWADAEPKEFMPGRDITPVLLNPESEPVLDEWSNVPTMMTYVKNRYEPTEMATRLENEDWEACMYGEDTPWYFMIVVKNHKYTRYANPNRIEELYDLDNDPEELDNLAIKAQYKSKVLEMRAACIQSIKDNGGSVFADFLPPPTTENWWPAGVSLSDNAHVLDGSDTAQSDDDVLKTKNGWGSSDSRLAYLRYDLSGDNEINNTPADSIATASLDLWMTQTEGDVENDLQVFALVDGAQDSPTSLSESGWTNSAGANPLLDTNLPQGDNDPNISPLTTVMLGSHTFAAIGDNNELGLLQIPLSVSDLQTLIENDSNGEITLIIRSTSSGLSANFTSISNTDSQQAAPTLAITARPATPTGLNATALNGSVVLDWNDNTEPNLTVYKVYRSTVSENYGDALTPNPTSNAFVDNTVSNGTTYFYTVSAVDANNNESNQTTEVSATPEESSIPAGTILFGSDNEGFAGFTSSTPDASQESWSVEPDSVRYINDDPDGITNSSIDGSTKNGSLLREFTLNRSVGNIYTIQGIINLTNGYGDDNNRLGLYLFGDVPDLNGPGGPGENEAGALSLHINTDSDNNDIRITEGLDRSVLVSENKTGGLMDDNLYGTTLTFIANIEFVNESGTDYIDISFTLTDAVNNMTTTNSRVLASDYTGDYFGFATRSRNRGETSSNRNAPFTMDYQSLYLLWNNEPLDDYEQWAYDNGIGSDAEETDDFDGDGVSNLYEYGLGGDPNDDQDQGTIPTFTKLGDSIAYVYPYRSDTDILTYTVESSTNLASDTWSAAEYTISGTDVTGETLDFATIIIDMPQDKLFIRLKIDYK